MRSKNCLLDGLICCCLPSSRCSFFGGALAFLLLGLPAPAEALVQTGPVVQTNPTCATLDIVGPQGQSDTVVLRGDMTLNTAPTAGQMGSWQTEIVSMSLTGNSPVLGDIELQADPQRPSTGMARNPQPGPGGACLVDVTMDVHTVVTLPGLPPLQVEAIGMISVDPVPIIHDQPLQLVMDPQQDQAVIGVPPPPDSSPRWSTTSSRLRASSAGTLTVMAASMRTMRRLSIIFSSSPALPRPAATMRRMPMTTA